MKPYKIYIMEYAENESTSSRILLGDPHMTPMMMSYYMWVITNGEHTVAVDMGFTEPVCKARERNWLAEPVELLDRAKVDPRKVEHVIVTHFHWDHVGNYELFPRATLYVQEDEMAFWTGRYAKYEVFNRSIELEDVLAIVRFNYAGRVHFVRGSAEIVPGVRVHRVGGHTKGMQIVEVATARGTAVLCSDASHYYANYQTFTPFTTLHNVPEMLEGFELIRRLGDDESLIVPGHDPEVMKRYPLHAERVALLE